MEITCTKFFMFVILAAVLCAAAVIDIRTLYVPDVIHLCLLGLAAISLITEHGPAPADRVFASFTIGGAMLAVSVLTKGGIGGGDIKLMAAAGLLLGFPRNLLAFILAYVSAGLVYAVPMFRGNLDRNRPIPMIPYFAAAILVSYLFGDRIISWYLHDFVM